MTVHKAQGQGYDYVGIDFSGTIFTHGLVYVAISRCTSMNNIRIFFGPTEKDQYLLRNLVFTDLLEYANGNLNALPTAPPRRQAPHLPEYDDPVEGIAFDDDHEQGEEHIESDRPPRSSSPFRAPHHYVEYDHLTDDDIDTLREWKSNGYDHEKVAELLWKNKYIHISKDFWEKAIRA
jgi:hypothetical protein